MPGYGNPITDVLNFGLSAGGNPGGYSPGYLPPRLGYGGDITKTTGETSSTGAAGAGLKFNLSSGKDITQLSDLINSINRSAQASALQSRIPNNPELEKVSSANINTELHGGVPSDVLQLLQQQAAERGVGTGVGSSDNTNAAYLKALGLTSLGQMEQGQRDLSAADARNPIAPLFNPAELLLTPAQNANTNLGYISEGNRTALEQERLALEALRGGGGSHAPYGYGGGGTTTNSSPYQYGEPGIFAYGSPLSPTTVTGSSVLPVTDINQAQWWNSIGYGNPAADVEAGVATTPTDYRTLFPGSTQVATQGTGE